MLGHPPFPAPPLLPWPLGAHRSSPPPLTAGRRPRPSPLPLYPLVEFPTLPSTSPSRSQPKPSRETRYRVNSGEAPPLAAARPSPPALPHRPSRQHVPHRRIEIRRPTSDLDPSQQIRVPVNRDFFCRLALTLSENQPALHLSSKVITIGSCFFCLGPCSFPK
jgi:hypothetical protein